jgi:hypothetical protein
MILSVNFNHLAVGCFANITGKNAASTSSSEAGSYKFLQNAGNTAHCQVVEHPPPTSPENNINNKWEGV